MKIIGLSGTAGSGKDYIFSNFIKPLGFYRFALADHFKIGAVGRKLVTYDEVFYTKPEHIRDTLQKMGTEEGRDIYGDDIWLDTTYVWLHHLNITWGVNKFCITDVRFPNEVEYIQSRGGIVIRVEAPNRSINALTDKTRSHISEVALDNYDGYDYRINNDPENANQVGKDVFNIISKIL